MSAIIATVASVDGKFFVKGQDGSLRELTKGDAIYEGEIVVGDSSNSQINSIIVSTVDGTDIVMLGSESQLFDASISTQEFAPNETITDVGLACAI